MSFDANVLVAAWLAQSTELQSLVGSNIFPGVLPEDFSCADGSKALCIRRRGGKPHPEIPAWRRPSFAVEAWAEEEPDAAQIYGAAREFMQGETNITVQDATTQAALGRIIMAQEEVEGQDIIDPITKFAICVGYFQIDCHAPEN